MRISSYPAVGGFTLIEVLVAALIMGIGMLGLVSLQTRALQYNQQAYLHSQAAFLAYDIVDRMRANELAADNYKIDFEETISGVSFTACIESSCGASDMARWDLKIWKDNITASLPEGDGSIVWEQENDQYVIIVKFDASRGDDQDNPKQIKVRVRLRK